MRGLFRLALFSALVGGSLSASTINYTVINLNTVNGNNQPLYRYIYDLMGVQLALNQELEIRFEVTQYASLTNGVAPLNSNSFDLLLFQPNNPVGAAGIYSLLAIKNNPSMAGPFSVDAAWIGIGSPGTQAFTINQLDAQGRFVSQLEAGVTQTQGSSSSSSSSSGGSATPEPATMLLSVAGIAAIQLARRRSRAAKS